MTLQRAFEYLFLIKNKNIFKKLKIPVNFATLLSNITVKFATLIPTEVLEICFTFFASLPEERKEGKDMDMDSVLRKSHCSAFTSFQKFQSTAMDCIISQCWKLLYK